MQITSTKYNSFSLRYRNKPKSLKNYPIERQFK